MTVGIGRSRRRRPADRGRSPRPPTVSPIGIVIADTATGQVRAIREGSDEDPRAVVGQRSDQGEPGISAFDDLTDQRLEDVVGGRVPGGRSGELTDDGDRSVAGAARLVGGAGGRCRSVRIRPLPGPGWPRPGRLAAQIPGARRRSHRSSRSPDRAARGLADASHQLGVVRPVGETTDAGLQVEERTDDAIVELARDPLALGADLRPHVPRIGVRRARSRSRPARRT